MAVVTFAILLPRRTAWAAPWPILAAVGWLATTSLWSQDPRTTINGTLLYLAIAVLAWAAAARTNLDDLPNAAAVGLGLVILTTIVAAIVDPGTGGRWRAWSYDWFGTPSLQGLYGNRNILAYTVALLAPAALTAGRARWAQIAVRTVLLLACGAVLYKIRSGTGIIAFLALFALGVLAFIVRRALARTSGHRRTALLTLGAGGVALITAFIPAVLSRLGKDIGTVSGRVPLWDAIIDVSRDRLLLGNGWASVWNYHWLPAGQNSVRRAINDSLPSPLAHGHNAALDLLPQVGLLGVALFVAIQIWVIVRLLRAPWTSTSSWAALTIAAISIVGLTEPTWSIPLGWALLTIVASVAARTKRAPHGAYRGMPEPSSEAPGSVASPRGS